MQARTRPLIRIVVTGLALGGVLLLAEPPVPAGAQTTGSEFFTDVEGETHADAIDRIHEAGIVEG
ncbi:MAG: hypothetical protein WD638_08045, partial [Nitriliruptoraceae bacterium]